MQNIYTFFSLFQLREKKGPMLYRVTQRATFIQYMGIVFYWIEWKNGRKLSNAFKKASQLLKIHFSPFKMMPFTCCNQLFGKRKFFLMHFAGKKPAHSGPFHHNLALSLATVPIIIILIIRTYSSKLKKNQRIINAICLPTTKTLYWVVAQNPVTQSRISSISFSSLSH